MPEVTKLSKLFNRLMPGRIDRLNRELYKLSWRGFSMTRNGTEEELWDKMEALIKAGADVNVPGADGATILNCICGQELPTVARKLVEAGADVNQTGKNGTTPVMMATYAADPDTLHMLLDHGANAVALDSSGRNASYELIYGGNSKAKDNPDRQARCMRFLLKAGLTLSMENKIRIFHNNTKLVQAVPEIADAMALDDAGEAQDADKLAALIAKGVHPDACAPYGEATPFFKAAYRNNFALLTMLRAAGADPNLRPWNADNPPLLGAAERGQEATVGLLLDLGADPEIKTKYGKTLMECAEKGGIDGFVTDLLQQRQAPPDVALQQNITTMHRLKLKTAAPTNA